MEIVEPLTAGNRLMLSTCSTNHKQNISERVLECKQITDCAIGQETDETGDETLPSRKPGWKYAGSLVAVVDSVPRIQVARLS